MNLYVKQTATLSSAGLLEGWRYNTDDMNIMEECEDEGHNVYATITIEPLILVLRRIYYNLRIIQHE